MTAPKCSSSGMTYKHSYNYDTDDEQIFVGMRLATYGKGCHKCVSNFVSVYNSDPLYVCTEIGFSSIGQLENNVFIENCINYTIIDDIVQCEKCATNFVNL